MLPAEAQVDVGDGLARPSAPQPLRLGRYLLCNEIGRGGMATVYVGRLLGDGGFVRTVAIKRLQPQLASDPNVAAMLLDEARIAARIRHPNVIPTLDAVAHSGELFVVMEYVEGASLAQLMRVAVKNEKPPPLEVLSSVMAGVLQGLHAAHGATDEDGAPLGIVHRDVSPQNVLVGSDGTARVFDFGIAKAVGRAHNTRDGQIKGKLAYMAPEQILGQDVDLRVDLFAAGTLLWEITTGHRLFYGDNEGAILHRVLHAEIPLPSTLSARIPPELDAVIMRALQREPQLRFATAAEMGAALEHAVAPAPTRDVAKWVLATEGEAIRHRADGVTAMEARFTDAVTLSAHDVSKRPERRMRRLWLAPAVIGVAVGAVGAVEWQRMQSNTRAPNAPASAPAPPSVEVAPPATASPPAMTVAPSATALPEPSVASASASPRRAPRKPPPTARPAATPAAPPPLYSRD